MWQGERGWTARSWEAEEQKYQEMVDLLLDGSPGKTPVEQAPDEFFHVCQNIRLVVTGLRYRRITDGYLPIGAQVDLQRHQEAALLKAYETFPQQIAALSVMLKVGIQYGLPYDFIKLLVSLRSDRGGEEISESELADLYWQYKSDPKAFAAGVKYTLTESPEAVGQRLSVVSLVLALAIFAVSWALYPVRYVALVFLALGGVGGLLGFMLRDEVVSTYHEAYRRWAHGMPIAAVARYALLIVFLILTWAYQLGRLVLKFAR